MTDSAEQLMLRVVEGDESDGTATNDLLREFFRGHPVAHLRRLLTSRNQNAVAAGAFIASELGARAAPLQELLVRLARHPLPSIRCDVVGAVQGMNELAAPDSVAAVVAGIVDPDAAVRWRTIRLLSFIGESLLRSSISHIAAPELKSAIAALVLPYADFNSARIVDQLRSSGPLQHRVALATAIRVRHVSPEALRFAAAQGDQEVREIASEFLVEWSRVDKESSDA